MTNQPIQDELAARLEAVARSEKRSVEAILSSLLDLYISLPQHLAPEAEDVQIDPLAAMDGMFDDDITDLSTTVRETMDAYYRKKYGSSG
jgi:hypothetical protein